MILFALRHGRESRRGTGIGDGETRPTIVVQCVGRARVWHARELSLVDECCDRDELGTTLRFV